MDIEESGVVLKFQSQSFKVARYSVRRKVEAKDLPQGSAAADLPLPIDWEMSKPLTLPPRGGKPWESALPPEGASQEKERQETGQITDQPPDTVTVTTDLPKESSREVSIDRIDSPPGPGDPVAMSVDSTDSVHMPTPDSDESWTELYERFCGDSTPTGGDRGREKRPRSPEFIREKRPKRDDALRVAFVNIKETIKAHCDFPMGSLGRDPPVWKVWKRPSRCGLLNYVNDPVGRGSRWTRNVALARRLTRLRLGSWMPGEVPSFLPDSLWEGYKGCGGYALGPDLEGFGGKAHG